MKTQKGSVLVIFLVIIGVVAIIWSSLSHRKEGPMEHEKENMEKEESMMMENGMMTEEEMDSMKKEAEGDNMMMEGDSMMKKESKGSFEDYDASKLSLANEGKVVLFFNASWCPTCQAATKEFTNLPLPEGVTILSVDYDKYTDLKKKYGITYQHTFVQVDASGNVLSKWSGGGIAQLNSSIK